MERVGGKLHSFWFSYGDYDAVLIVEMPNNVDMASIAIAVSASGGLKALKTTPLLSVEESVSALIKASDVQYQPPSKTAVQVTA